jgi:hypothetical protein
MPQPPQFEVVVVDVSQPSPITPLQLPKPALQVMPQAPLVHDAVPLALLHAFPQALQFSGSVLRFFSQPFE